MVKEVMSDPHLRVFAKVLEKAIARYGEADEKDLTIRQKKQVERLVFAERGFRKALAASHYGPKVYVEFCRYIQEDRRNLSSARPFFRERQEVFKARISAALRTANVAELVKFDINYNFIAFALRCRKWHPNSPVARLAREAREARETLVEMNMPLALNRTRIFWGRTRRGRSSELLPGGAHLDYMDLVQISAEGLMAGIDKFCLPYSPVFRSVAIGRMVGNLIEHNSQTLLHFFPLDRRKIYRANKILARNNGEIPDAKISEINVGIPDAQQTDHDEIVQLVAGAVCASGDVETQHEDGEGETMIDGFAAPESDRPDVRAEVADTEHVVAEAISGLSLFQQKVLRLRGIDFGRMR